MSGDESGRPAGHRIKNANEIGMNGTNADLSG
jgi:hypothetical protein